MRQNVSPFLLPLAIVLTSMLVVVWCTQGSDAPIASPDAGSRNDPAAAPPLNVLLPSPEGDPPARPRSHPQWIVRVTDHRGVPVEGATITVTEHPHEEIAHDANQGQVDMTETGALKTDSTGCAEFGAPDPGCWYVRATHDGHAAAQVAVDVAKNETRRVELVIRELGSASIRVQLSDGSPAVSAQLSVTPGMSPSSLRNVVDEHTVGESGAVELHVHPGTLITLHVEFDSVHQSLAIAPFEPGEHRDLGVVRLPSLTLIQGVVRYEDGEPARRATVLCVTLGEDSERDRTARVWTQVEVDLEGRFSLLAVSGRDHALEATALGFVDTRSTVFVQGERQSVDLVLRRGEELARQVRFEDGRVADGVAVTLGEPGHARYSELRTFGRCETGGDGSFHLVALDIPDHQPVELRLSRGGITQRYGASSLRELPTELSIRRGTTLRVEVSSLDNMTALPGLRYLVTDQDGQVVAHRSSQGSILSLHGLEGGSYEARVEASGFRAITRRVLLRDGVDTTLPLELVPIPPPRPVEVTVRSAAGNLAGVALSIMGHVGPGHTRLTNDRGRARLRLSEQDVLLVSHEGYGTVEIEPKGKNGWPASVAIELQPEAVLRLDLEAEIEEFRGESPSFSLRADGRVFECAESSRLGASWNQLAPGRYRLTVSLGSSYQRSESIELVPGRRAGLTWSVPPRFQIWGSLFDSTGQPLAGRVRLLSGDIPYTSNLVSGRFQVQLRERSLYSIEYLPSDRETGFVIAERALQPGSVLDLKVDLHDWAPTFLTPRGTPLTIGAVFVYGGALPTERLGPDGTVSFRGIPAGTYQWELRGIDADHQMTGTFSLPRDRKQRIRLRP